MTMASEVNAVIHMDAEFAGTSGNGTTDSIVISNAGPQAQRRPVVRDPYDGTAGIA